MSKILGEDVSRGFVKRCVEGARELFASRLSDHYRPERHYMRGAGPASRRKTSLACPAPTSDED